MAFFDYLIWGVVVLIIGGSIGILSAKLAAYHLKKQDKKKIVRVIEGKTPNTLKLDGDLIQVDKFQYKKSDGEIVKVKLSNIAKKTSQVPLNEEKTSLFERLKSKSREKK